VMRLIADLGFHVSAPTLASRLVLSLWLNPRFNEKKTLARRRRCQ
jgi:hypothetical protein